MITLPILKISFSIWYQHKGDVPFGELKLVDVPAWLSRRTFNPYRTVNRAFWRWNIKYFDVKKGGLAWTMQLAFVISFTTFIIRYDHHQYERHAKYH
ncbi:hypothetical protein ACJMK2_033597 [Sinanodonta woodiana]|uniref:ATP synthase subunit f, mitochondrial n=1 Tax=Sinanodonta woodiana TaxID=1069815 RepID=A0ABD3WNS8_SINWO